MMRAIVAAAAVLFATAATSQAAIITNGGFETGDLTGWSTSGADLAISTTFDTPHTGSYNFQGFDNSGFASLSQTFATTPGASYFLDFWSFVGVFHPGNILRYQLDAGPILTVAPTLAYALTHDSFTAGGASTTLSFYFETDPGTHTWRIDDVSVSPAQSSGAVPEPTSLALFGIGACVAGAGAALRRRRDAQHQAAL